MADEEDEAIPNDGSFVPFPALLLCQHMGRCKEKTKAPNSQ